MTKVLTISSIQKRIAVGVMAIAMLFGMAFVAPSAHAQVTSEDDLQSAIDNLMGQINGISGTLDDNEDVARLDITTSPNSPDSAILEVDDNDESDEKEVFVVRIKEVNGLDVTIEEVTMRVTASNSYVPSVVDEVILYVDGDEVGSDTPTASGRLVFENLDINIEGDSSVDIYVEAVFNGTDEYAEGDTVTFVFEEVLAAEDENGNDEGDMEGVNPTDFESEVFTLRSKGLMAHFVGDDAEAVGTNSELGEFSIKFDVTAFGDDMYIPNGGIIFGVMNEDNEPDRGPTTVSYSSAADEVNDKYLIEEGRTETFTIRVAFNPDKDGNYRLVLMRLNYENESGTQSPITSDELDQSEFRTDFVYLDATETTSTGETSEEVRVRLQAEINRLMALVEALMQALSQGSGGDPADGDLDDDVNYTYTNWGNQLINSEAEIPTGKFRFFKIRTDTMQEVGSSQTVSDIYYDGIDYGTGGYTNRGAYWVGRFNLPANRNIYFDMSDPQRSNAKLYIDGQIVLSDQGTYKYTARTAGPRIVEVVFDSNWHADTFAVTHTLIERGVGYNMAQPLAMQSKAYNSEAEMKNIINGRRDFSTDSNVFVASVYESGADDGKVVVTLPDADQSGIIVLSSYSPVNWILKNYQGADLYGAFVYSYEGASSVTADSSRLQTNFSRGTYIGSGNGETDEATVAKVIGVGVDEITDLIYLYNPKSLAFDDAAEPTEDELQDVIDDVMDQIEDVDDSEEDIDEEEESDDVDDGDLEDEIDNLLEQIQDQENEVSNDSSEEVGSVGKFYANAIDVVNRRDFYRDELQTDLAYRQFNIKLKNGTIYRVRRQAGTSETTFTQQLRDIGYYGTLEKFQAKVVKMNPRVLGATTTIDSYTKWSYSIDDLESSLAAYLAPRVLGARVSVDPVTQLSSAIDGFEAALAAFIK